TELFSANRTPVPRTKPSDRFMAKLSSVAQPDARARSLFPLEEKAHRDFSAAAQALIDGYRLHGYRVASIDPLEGVAADSSTIPERDPKTYGLAFDDSPV